MTAIILAAGMGTRLKPYTDTKPKCMIQVAGKPILQHQIEAYRDAGITKIIVVTGYFSEQLHEFVSGYGQLVQCVYNEDFNTTNNMYSLYLALQQVEDQTSIVLGNGDVVMDSSIIRNLMKQPGSVIAVDKGSYDEESMKIVVSEGYVQKISKLIKAEEAYGNSIDVYKFEGAFFEEFKSVVESTIEEEGNLNDWTEVAIDKALFRNTALVRPFEIGSGRWTEVDNYEDLQMADQKFSQLAVDEIELFFVDLDGTLFLGDQIIEGAAEFVQQLQSEGRGFKLLSNNSSNSKLHYVNLLGEYGIKIGERDIVLSSDAAIDHIKKIGYKSVFVLGTEALRRSVAEEGIDTEGEDFDCVLVGYDTELTYDKLKKAALLLNKKCAFIATHSDIVCPTVDGPIPDIGAILALIKAATGCEPDRIFGKPDKEMVQFLIDRKGVELDKVAFIGDRLYTDMLVARNTGAKFILVLSGETKREDLNVVEDFPDLIIPSVANIFA